MSQNPNDLRALCPFDFLIQGNVSGISETDERNCNLNSRWEMISYTRQEFWERFNREYLTTLQQKFKWNRISDNITTNRLVILKDSKLPLMKWEMGRIINTILGSDNLVRVVDVKTKSGIKRRAITEISPLPVKHNEHENENYSNTIQKIEDSEHDQKSKLLKRNKFTKERNKIPNKNICNLIVFTFLLMLILPVLGK